MDKFSNVDISKVNELVSLGVCSEAEALEIVAQGNAEPLIKEAQARQAQTGPTAPRTDPKAE